LRAARRAQFRDRIARVGLCLEDRLGDRMGLLSGDQRQAVSLVMATLRPAKILLLDVADEERAGLGPADLVALFAEVRGQELDSDSLLLS